MIPHLLHFIWLGTNPLPDEFARYMAGWLRHHSGWQVRFWTDENLPTQVHDMPLFQSLTCPSDRSSLLRYLVLHLYGGLYVDCDFECLRNIEEHLEGREILLSRERTGYPEIANAITAAAPGHPFLWLLLQNLPHSVSNYAGTVARTGPKFITRTYEQSGRSFALMENARVFFPYYPFSGESRAQRWPETVAVHHWAGSWRSEPYEYQKRQNV